MSDASSVWNVYYAEIRLERGVIKRGEEKKLFENAIFLIFLSKNLLSKSDLIFFKQTKRSDFLPVQFTRDSFLETKKEWGIKLEFISTPLWIRREFSTLMSINIYLQHVSTFSIFYLIQELSNAIIL